MSEMKKDKNNETADTVVITADEKASDKKEVKKAKKEKKPKKVLDAKAKKKRRRIIILSIVGVLVVGFIVLRVISANGPQAVVYTTGAENGSIEQTISTSGTVATENSKSYFSDVDVKIGDVVAKAGDAVKAGDVIIQYDADDLAKATELAQLTEQSNEGNYQNSIQTNNRKLGDLSEATVNLDVLDQQIEDTKKYITNLEYKITKKKSELQHEGALLQISLIDWKDHPDSEEYENLQKLVQENSYEQNNNKEVQSWNRELDVYNDMLKEYESYKSEMRSQKSSSESSTMTKGAKEELEASNQTKEIQAQDTLQNLEAVKDGVVAEFDGVITELTAVEGSTVAKGSQLLKLESTEDVKVDITVTKYDLDKIAVGQKATITIGANQYEGQVSKINKMAEKNNSGAAVVGTEIKLDNPDSNVILGVEAKVVISTASVENTIVVPVSAVNVDMDGEFVYAVENNILVKKQIVTGISSDTMVQVTEGLAEGDQIVTEVTGALQEGITVAAIPQ